jgi:two-component system response regulator AtoC
MAKKEVKIILVDDDPNMLRLMEFYLQSEPYEITTAINGKKALSLLQKEKFDLLLADMQMPEMDGYTLLKNIKRTIKNNIPIIMVTAYGQVEDAELPVKAGAYDILQKPFTAFRLRLTVRNALDYKRVIDNYEHLKNLKRKK